MGDETAADRDHWQHLESLLDQALDLPASDRSAFLDATVGSRPELRRELEELLAADRGVGRFLERPVHEMAATFVEEVSRREGEELGGRMLGPYLLVQRLGAGGMGEVYEARDTRLDRRVALKLLPGAWTQDPAAKQRFLKEAKIASGLDHPNLCTLHDVGESEEGQPYLVMTYYRGETLAQEIERGALEIERFSTLAIQLARGLERIHAAEITHRDMKPANVMVIAGDEGEADQVKILDFGIAKTTDATGLTATGSSLGTPAYMSPEQVAGDAVDTRSDVFSLGVMFYEMLAGQRPFQAEDPRAVMHAIENRSPEPLTHWRDDLPAALEQVVIKALAKNPDERYQSVAAMRADIESGNVPALGHSRPSIRPFVILIIASLAAVVGWIFFNTDLSEVTHRGPSPPTAATDGSFQSRTVAETPPTLAVLPFVNHTGEPKLDWYGAGIARLVMDDLAQSRHLHVVSWRRVQALVEGEMTPAAAARRGVEVLLVGEILSGASGLSVAMRLDETQADGIRLTARRLDGLTPQDLLTVADDLARATRRALSVPLTETVDVFAADFAAENPDAYEDYLSGLRAFVEYRFDDSERSFAAALDKAPGFTMARYRLAHAEATQGRTEEALANIRRAVAEAGRLPERDALYVRALEAYVARRFDDAIELYRRLIASHPYDGEARLLLSLLLGSLGRHQEVIEQMDVLKRLEPENHIIWSLAGEAHLNLGENHRAAVEIEHYLDLEPDSANGHHMLGNVYRAQGELDLASAEYSAALAIDPKFYFAELDLALLDVVRGHRRDSEERLERLAGDSRAPPRHRIDATFELASLLRSDGRCRQSVRVLAQLEDLIAEEGVREARALADRGSAWIDIGQWRRAEELIARSIERSPGVATRYLFARGMLELRQQRFKALERTVLEILAGALPPENPDRTEEKAATYLRGLGWLEEGRTSEALKELSRAIDLEGHAYGVYHLGLARAHLAAGQLRQAMAAARRAAEERDVAAPRLDLELDRTRARLVLARVLFALGRREAAADEARKVLEQWQRADPGFADVTEARRLIES